MELEVNKSHKKVDLSKVKKPLIRFGAASLVSLIGAIQGYPV